MSWFNRNGADTVEDSGRLEYPAIDSEVPKEELAQGVLLERRQVLWISVSAALGLMVGGGSWRYSNQARRLGTNSRSNANEDLVFEDFVSTVSPMADELVQSGNPNEERYLATVASLISRVNLMPSAFRNDAFRYGPSEAYVTIQPEVRKVPLVVSQLYFEPESIIPCHDHRDYNGVILGISGEVRCRNYEIVPEMVQPQSDSVHIRKTVDQQIIRGQVSTLSRTRDNIHDLRAGTEGARMLDVFTFFEDDSVSYELDVDEKPIDKSKQVYRAAWKNPL